jgi:hypothetical protein
VETHPAESDAVADRRGRPSGSPKTHALSPEEERFLRGELRGDDAERALLLLVDRAATAADGVFFSCEDPEDV